MSWCWLEKCIFCNQIFGVLLIFVVEMDEHSINVIFLFFKWNGQVHLNSLLDFFFFWPIYYPIVVRWGKFNNDVKWLIKYFCLYTLRIELGFWPFDRIKWLTNFLFIFRIIRLSFPISCRPTHNPVVASICIWVSYLQWKEKNETGLKKADPFSWLKRNE